MGIVFWMFPKWSRERPRGSEGLAVVTYALLNLGLLLRVIGEPARAVDPNRACGAGCWSRRRSCNGWPACSSWPTPGPGSRSAEMPRLSVWFIRMALLYLLAGFTLGALLLAHKGLAVRAVDLALAAWRTSSCCW
jgi:hypothetical protein